MHAYITLDVDPDFTNPNKGWENARRGIEECIAIFREFSLEEHITWLVNNAELEFTSKRSSYLSKMSVGEIGLHLHLDRPPWSSNYYYLPEKEEKIYAAIKKEKERLERWTVKNIGREIISFRSGDFLADDKLFRVLNRLDIKVDSSLPSQFDWSLKEIARKVLSYMPLSVKLAVSKILVNKRAYPTLSLGAKPFMIGRVLEMPVHVYVGGSNIADGIKKVKIKTHEQIKRGVKDLVIYWHPHEILNRENIYLGYMEYIVEQGFEFKTLGESYWR
ncbi:MAG: hypothetical protein DRI61_16475 [Chloroflexi bacterium]|nr:MAG: hypothetical protein DRI61_16475 [Chloroflexota bacterium]